MNFSLPYVCSVIQAYLKKVDTINKINEGKKELKALLILNL